MNLQDLTGQELKAKMKDLLAQAKPWARIAGFLTEGQEKNLARLGDQMDAIRAEMNRRKL